MRPEGSLSSQLPSSGPIPPQSASSLVTNLLHRGHQVEAVGGRLIITPSSGKPVPSEWLRRRYQQIATEIARQLRQELYIYESYSTGRFNKGRLNGVQLQFASAATRDSRFAVFNAEIGRQRDTKHGRAGTILPNKQFKAGRKSAFAEFWHSAGLPQPQRRGWYGNLMGKLKNMIFTGTGLAGEKLDKHSLRPLNLGYCELLELFGLARQNNAQTGPGQTPNTPQTHSSNTKSPEAPIWRRVQLDPTAGAPDHGNTVIRGCGYQGQSELPKEQTDEDWWADYDRRDLEHAEHDSWPAKGRETTL